MNNCCKLRKQIEDQETEFIVKARQVLNYDLRQILVKSRSKNASEAVAQIDALADEWDKLIDLYHLAD